MGAGGRRRGRRLRTAAVRPAPPHDGGGAPAPGLHGGRAARGGIRSGAGDTATTATAGPCRRARAPASGRSCAPLVRARLGNCGRPRSPVADARSPPLGVTRRLCSRLLCSRRLRSRRLCSRLPLAPPPPAGLLCRVLPVPACRFGARRTHAPRPLRGATLGRSSVAGASARRKCTVLGSWT